MVTRFKLEPAPTFKGKVGIPVPFGRPEMVEFVFKWRDRAGIREFWDALPEQAIETRPVEEIVESDAQLVMQVASGWELQEPFDIENVRTLCRNFPGAARVIIDTYLDELTKGREKN